MIKKQYNQTPSFGDYIKSEAFRLEACGQYGTSGNYRKTLSSITRFLSSEKRDISSFRIEDISPGLVTSYDAYLKCHNVCDNTISSYNRILRAVYNRAAAEFGIENIRPFAYAYTGAARTVSRAISSGEILKLASLSLPAGSSLELCRDIFIFCYVMRGMSFADAVFLKESDIRGEYVEYLRRKTGTLLRVRIEPVAKRIIRRYSSIAGNNGYIFPVLSGKTGAAAYQKYRSALSVHNRNLKKLGKMAGTGILLSSHVSRHSWANSARNENTPMSIISAALGHASERTTEIYLAGISSEKLDETNSRVLKKLNELASSSDVNIKLEKFLNQRFNN